MLDICLLGTGGMMPLPYRYLTSMIARYNGKSILIDCGEGTQVALRKKGWSPNPIDIICFTHFHADHISGLPGMLLTMGNAERKEPLLIIGPKGVSKIVGSLRMIAPELPFDIEFIEIEGNDQTIDFGDFSIKAFRVSHNVICYGYVLEVKRLGKFDPVKAKQYGIDIRYWNKLQHGETVTDESGAEYTPQMVMGQQRRGLKVTYVTDTRPTDGIIANSAESDLLICEGMYGEPGMDEKAKSHKHMTFYEAATIAEKAKVKEMWLTHYSPSLIKPDIYMDDVKKIFENAKAGKDGMSVDLLFDED